MVQTYSISKNMKTIVWAAFWDNGRTKLYIINRNFKSKKYRYSANSYLEVLNAEVDLVFESFSSEADIYWFI